MDVQLDICLRAVSCQTQHLNWKLFPQDFAIISAQPLLCPVCASEVDVAIAKACFNYIRYILNVELEKQTRLGYLGNSFGGGEMVMVYFFS